MTWRDEAACRGLTDLFFNDKQDSPHDTAAARAVCATCPVRVDCADYAADMGEVYGVWGGLTTQQLRKRRYQRGRQRQADHFATASATAQELHDAGHPVEVIARRLNVDVRSVYRYLASPASSQGERKVSA